MSSSKGTIVDTMWDGAVAPAPTSPDELNCSASQDNGLPVVEPAAAPRIAVNPHTATVDHALGKFLVLEADGTFHDVLTNETPSFALLFTLISHSYTAS